MSRSAVARPSLAAALLLLLAACGSEPATGATESPAGAAPAAQQATTLTLTSAEFSARAIRALPTANF